jgi:DNA polymerase-1
MGIDTETTGLKWWTPNFLRTTQFGDAEQAWVLPQQWWGRLVKDSIENYTGPIVAHNAKFEMHAFASAGIQMPSAKLEDTAFLAWLSDPSKRSGLKPISDRMLGHWAGFPEYLLKEYFRKNKVSWDTVPLEAEPYWFYGGWDPILTCQMWEKLQSYRGEAYDLEMALLPLVCKMETSGMGIDYEYVQGLRSEWAEEMASLRLACQSYGLNNPGSGPQIEAALRGEGWEPEAFTPTGRAMLNKGILSGIEHELGDIIIQYKRLQKWDSTYLKQFQEREDNGRVHGDIKQCEARTGRMSVVGPPLQTLPRGPIIRNCFVPGNGKTLVTVDYAQIELRLLAHYSRDPRMIEQFQAGLSLHKLLAKQLWGEEYDLEQYIITKNSWFSKAYGAGVEKFAETAHIPVGVAQGIYDGLDEEYPGIAGLQDEIIELGRRRLAEEGRAYVRLSDGTCLPADDDAVYALVDYQLQGEAAKILKRAAVSLDNAGLGDSLRMFVHDEVVAEVEAEDQEEWTKEAQSIMENLTDYRVPITVEATACPTSWGSKYAVSA